MSAEKCTFKIQIANVAPGGEGWATSDAFDATIDLVRIVASVESLAFEIVELRAGDAPFKLPDLSLSGPGLPTLRPGERLYIKVRNTRGTGPATFDCRILGLRRVVVYQNRAV